MRASRSYLSSKGALALLPIDLNDLEFLVAAGIADAVLVEADGGLDFVLFVLELVGRAEPLLMHNTATTEKNPLRQAVGWFIYITYSKRLRPT
jgi:hypothetical protein